MQRIWIAGSAGSGKTTLARNLGRKLDIPVYHKDQICWKENWQERTESERILIGKAIYAQEHWIYEGNSFTDSKKDGRFERCDTIIYLNINRFICLYRVWRRYMKERGTVPPDHSAGCEADFDWVAARYILFEYPKKQTEREKFFSEAEQAGKRVIILNGRRSVKKWRKEQGL